MKRLVIVGLCSMVVFSSIIIAHAETVVLPSGTSSSDLENVIDGYAEENKNSTAAASIAVFDGDNVLFDKAYGYSDIENEVRADADTVYEWGSVTKLLIWVSVMQLVEQGKLDLDEDISNYLPNGFFTKLNYDMPITITNLMNHNAGWQEVQVGLFVSDKSDIKELGKMLQETEPEQAFEPGTVCAYSNWSTALAGYIVERVSGEKFDEYVHNHIFKPLGMKNTGISPMLTDNEWVKEKRNGLKCYDTEMEPLGTCRYYIPLYPCGSAVGTIKDFRTFAQALIPEDRKCSPLFTYSDSLEEMLSPTLYYGDTDKAVNCHGLWTMQSANELVWHNGGTVGCSTMLCIDTTAKTGLVVMTNQSDEIVYTNGILPMIFGKYKYNQKNKELMNKVDLNGYYVYARTVFKGCLKLESILSVMNLKVQEDKKLSNKGLVATPISSNTYVAEIQGFGTAFMSANVDDDGAVHLQLPGGDYIKINKIVLYAQYSSLVLMAVAILYSMISMLIVAIRFIVKKIGKSSTTLIPVVKFGNVMRFSVILLTINLVVFVCRVNSLQVMSALSWQIILTGFLAFIPILNVVILIKQYKKIECSKKTRIQLVVNACLGMIVSVNVWYWEMYKFW